MRYFCHQTMNQASSLGRIVLSEPGLFLSRCREHIHIVSRYQSSSVISISCRDTIQILLFCCILNTISKSMSLQMSLLARQIHSPELRLASCPYGILARPSVTWGSHLLVPTHRCHFFANRLLWRWPFHSAHGRQFSTLSQDLRGES